MGILNFLSDISNISACGHVGGLLAPDCLVLVHCLRSALAFLLEARQVALVSRCWEIGLSCGTSVTLAKSWGVRLVCRSAAGRRLKLPLVTLCLHPVFIWASPGTPPQRVPTLQLPQLCSTLEPVALWRGVGLTTIFCLSH